MMYIYKGGSKHFRPTEITIGKVYKIINKGGNITSFKDDEGDWRNLRILTDPHYGVWVRCDFSIYLGLLK